MLRKSFSAISKLAFQPSALTPAIPISNIQSRQYSAKGAKGPTVAMVLTGCGALDGTEVTEAVSLMIHFAEKGYTVQFFAPDGESPEVVDHVTKNTEKNEIRNIQAESARISRVKILALKGLRSKNYEGLVIPGGAGVLNILSNFKDEPNAFTVQSDLEKLIKEFNKDNKPICATSHAALLVAKTLGTQAGGPGVKLSVGTDPVLEDAIKNLGNEVVPVKASGATIDEAKHVLSTPGYLAKNPSAYEVHQGIGEMVNELIKALRGIKEVDIDWNFQDFYALQVRKIPAQDWEFIKKELKQRLEDEKNKGFGKDSDSSQ